MICAVDNTEHLTRDDLHRHLRKLKIRQEEYYTRYEPRYCRYNGSPISFKNWSDYLATDFSSTEAMRNWMVENPQDAKKYAVELIARRATDKELTFMPCEIELKSLGYPRARYYESIGGVAAIASRLGLRTRFDYKGALSVENELGVLIIDTREQCPLNFSRVIRQKLEFGDYALETNQFLAVERKSLPDLIGTCVADYNRFVREIERVEEVGGYLVIMCEVAINDALAFDQNPIIARHTKLKPQVVFHNIRGLIQQFECIQFLFCDGRDEMERLIPTVLCAGDSVKCVDLQHTYTEGYL